MFRVSKHDQKNLRWWYLRKEQIDFDPPYQRKSDIWSQYDKAYLIDSMINDFDIPKIYLADFTYAPSKLNKGKFLYAIIDGKQRLNAIFDYIDNKYPLNKDFKYFNKPKIKLGGLTYQDLQRQYPEISDEFDNFNLTIMSVITNDSHMIDELFIRLNRSKPLTGSELRSAMPGPIPKIVNKLSAHEFFQSKIRFQKKRKAEFNLVAKILITEYFKNFVNTMKKNLDDFVKENKDKTESDFKNIYSKIERHLDNLSNIFVNEDPLLKTSGPILLYYWLVRAQVKNRQNTEGIREFLVRFNQCREEIQNSRKQNYENIVSSYRFKGDASDLLKYNVSLRSINNQKNLKLAYQILNKWYRNNS